MMDPRIEAAAAKARACGMDRRGFFGRLIAIVGGCVGARYELEASGSASSSLAPDPPEAMLEALPVKYPGEGATLEGYLSRPKVGGPFPAVIVIHQSAGLNDPMREVARRLAFEGFTALAVDLLSRQGGTASFATLAEATAAIATLADNRIVSDLDAAFHYLHSNSSVRPECIGVLGFCRGGQLALLYAAANPNLRAAVVFDGIALPNERLQEIQCPVLAHYGKDDARATETEEFMKKYGKSFEFSMYPATTDFFCNDGGPNYGEAAVQDAWARTLAFLRENLGEGPGASAWPRQDHLYLRPFAKGA
jgi:carboxymethylenebutenolidase